MKFGSVCTGIEGAAVAWEDLGWQCAFMSEVDDFPCKLLAHRYPDVPNRGDMTRFKEWPDEPDLDVLVGGTPCQSFSVAGLRKGLDDPRGDLALTYVAIAARYRPSWVVWENVPGLLSSSEGRDFACFLGLLTGTVVDVPPDGWKNAGIVAGIADAYGVAYRVLDAQYCGVPQRRRRVIVVGYLGDWRPAAAVLLELTSMRGDPPPSREARQGIAPGSVGGPGERGGHGGDGGRRGIAETVGALTSGTGDALGWRVGAAAGHVIPEAVGSVIPDLCPTLRAGGNRTGGDRPPGTDVDTCESLIPVPPPLANCLTRRMRKGINTECNEGQTLIPVAFKASHYTRDKDGAPSQVVPPLSADADKGDQDILVFDSTQITHPENRSNPQPGDPCHALPARGHAPAIAFSCKDSGADSGEIAPTLRSMNEQDGNANAGGQVAVAYPIISDADREDSSARTPSPDAEGRVRLRDPGLGIGESGDPMFTLQATKPHAVAFNIYPASGQGSELEASATDVSNSISAVQNGKSTERGTRLVTSTAVRRLTPRECERLQGFPDDWTAIPVGKRGHVAKDGPRYKALGNAFAVPMLKWVGERIAMVATALRESDPR